MRYTRNGQFSLDPQGRLVTAQGDPVLDTAGRAITATDGKVDPRRLGVVALANPRKEGDSLVTGTPAGAAAGPSAPARWRAPAPTPPARWST